MTGIELRLQQVDVGLQRLRVGRADDDDLELDEYLSKSRLGRRDVGLRRLQFAGEIPPGAHAEKRHHHEGDDHAEVKSGKLEFLHGAARSGLQADRAS